MARSYELISGDSHLDIPPERWVHHLPAEYRDRAPRTVRLQNGSDTQLIENRPPLSPGLQLTGVPFEELGLRPVTYEDGPGTGPPEQRLREQDQDGVEAEILYTHPSQPSFWRGVKEDEVYRAIIHAYNEWLAEEYCAYAPDRLLAMGVLPDTGVDDAIEEMRFCVQAGLKGVCIYRFPNGKGYPLPEDDRFWAAALELGVPITAHTNGGSTRFVREGPVFKYPNDHAASPGRDPVAMAVRFASENSMAPLQLAFAGVFDRFPNLRIYWAETQIGWLPYSFAQIDDNYERHRFWAKREWGLDLLERRPSEYLRDHALWGFMKDPFGVEVRHRIGVHSLIWGSDFAHPTGNWPHSRSVIEETFMEVSEDDKHLMLAGNVVDFFQLDDGA